MLREYTSLGWRFRRGGHLVAAPGPVAGSIVQVAARYDAAHAAVLIHHAQVAQAQ
jgi:hypothetical protein